MILAAAAQGGASVDLTTIASFAQFGLLGVFFVMLISRKFIVPKWTLDVLEENQKAILQEKENAHTRELAARDQYIASIEADRKELRKSLDELQDLTRQQMLPAMIEANRLTAVYVDTLARRGGVKSA